MQSVLTISDDEVFEVVVVVLALEFLRCGGTYDIVFSQKNVSQ